MKKGWRGHAVILAIDHSRFPAARAGVVPPNRIAEVESALKLALDLP